MSKSDRRHISGEDQYQPAQSTHQENDGRAPDQPDFAPDLHLHQPGRRVGVAAQEVPEYPGSLPQVWSGPVEVDLSENIFILFNSSRLYNLNDEDDHEADVDDGEQGPEEPAGVEDAENLEDESHSDDQEDMVGHVCDISVAELVDLEEDQDGDAVHEGGVELEVLCRGADVVTTTEDPLQDERCSHGVEYAVRLRYSNIQRVASSQVLHSVQLVMNKFAV